jgi:hypothetical protein
MAHAGGFAHDELGSAGDPVDDHATLTSSSWPYVWWCRGDRLAPDAGAAGATSVRPRRHVRQMSDDDGHLERRRADAVTQPACGSISRQGSTTAVVDVGAVDAGVGAKPCFVSLMMVAAAARMRTDCGSTSGLWLRVRRVVGPSCPRP